MPVVHDTDGTPVDLDEWIGEWAHRWTHQIVGRLTVRLGWGLLVLVAMGATAWAGVRADLVSLHAQDQAFETHGTTPGQLTRAQLDSLRIALRYLPDQVAAEVLRRLRAEHTIR